MGVSNLFIPQLQVGKYGAHSAIPGANRLGLGIPDLIFFGLFFIVAMVILAVMLMRMKIFQAIKLGEAV